VIVLTLAEVAAATGGRLVDADAASRVTADVVTDSRRVGPGALFVALPGSRVDGHDFAAAALAAGAVAVLADREVGGPAVLVDDPVAALGRLARAVVDRIEGLTVVGVTGSSGKTSTKDLIAVLLADAGPTVAPVGSFNNEIGLPLTALGCGPGTRYLVSEMGAREPGNISYLCAITPPRIAVVLNVGAAHVGVFGSREVTARTKAELVAALPPGGVAVLNADDPVVAAMPVPDGATTVLTGRSPNAQVRAEKVQLDAAARARFELVTPAGRAAVSLRLHGEHHVPNALAAAAVGLAVGLAPDRIARLLSGAEPASRWRMEVGARADGVTVVNDAYNANPDSVRAALGALVAMRPPTAGAGWAVLGEMLELGDAAAAEHEAVGAAVARLGIDRLIAVGGPITQLMAKAAESGGMPARAVTWVPDRDAALAVLARQVRPGDVVLVKASRSIGLDVLAGRLLDPDHGTGAPVPAGTTDSGDDGPGNSGEAAPGPPGRPDQAVAAEHPGEDEA
jgi:UDP-N-acetylmuramoyl-tripeptide--D-alanyl-D-alanine ligase